MTLRATLFGLVSLLALANCRGDETVAAYGGSDVTWRLVELDGEAFKPRATLRLEAKGEITGEAPCNRYFGTQTAPYPWFAAEKIGATRRACPELDAETAFLAALSEMTLSEVLAGTLILSNDAGREMVFKADTAQD